MTQDYHASIPAEFCHSRVFNDYKELCEYLEDSFKAFRMNGDQAFLVAKMYIEMRASLLPVTLIFVYYYGKFERCTAIQTPELLPAN